MLFASSLLSLLSLTTACLWGPPVPPPYDQCTAGLGDGFGAFHMRADDHIYDVRFNGVQLTNFATSTFSDTVCYNVVPGPGDVIAFEVGDGPGGDRGMMWWLDPPTVDTTLPPDCLSPVTGQDWSCGTPANTVCHGRNTPQGILWQPPANWADPGFDSSTWTHAVFSPQTAVSLAQWHGWNASMNLWAEWPGQYTNRLYCRIEFPISCPCPLTNGGCLGDPSCGTYDGARYSYHDCGVHTMVSSPANGLEVQMSNVKLNVGSTSNGVSSVGAMAIDWRGEKIVAISRQYGSATSHLYKVDGQVLNAVGSQWSFTSTSGDVQVFRAGVFVHIHLGAATSYNGEPEVEIKLKPYTHHGYQVNFFYQAWVKCNQCLYKNKIDGGLLGDFNGNPLDDYNGLSAWNFAASQKLNMSDPASGIIFDANDLAEMTGPHYECNIGEEDACEFTDPNDFTVPQIADANAFCQETCGLQGLFLDACVLDVACIGEYTCTPYTDCGLECGPHGACASICVDDLDGAAMEVCLCRDGYTGAACDVPPPPPPPTVGPTIRPPRGELSP